MKALVVWLAAAGLVGAAPAPLVFQSAAGRFEISSSDIATAQTLNEAADEAWRWLGPLLGLPDSFSSPVFVRQVPLADWQESAPFRAIVEPGGVVSLRIGWSSEFPLTRLRRGLVQSLLLRLAVAQHGVNERLHVPLWLEHGCVLYWESRADGAQLDRLRQESTRLAPISLPGLLGWARGAEETEEQRINALWLCVFLQAESSPELAEWRRFLRRSLGGERGGDALVASYPGRFDSERERELWWSTGYHQVRRARTLPVWEAAESRSELEALTRFIGAEGEHDVVFSLATVLAHGREPFIAAELERRASELTRILPALHPFYRNAGLSLATVFATRTKDRAAQDQARVAFERDWRDAIELQAATGGALDAWENRGGPRRSLP